ncbi:MAG: hypothetical protein WD491_08165, partial [Balneolales bacterium]
MPLPYAFTGKPDITITFDGIVPRTEKKPPNLSGRVWRKEHGHHVLQFYNAEGYMTQFKMDANGSHIRIAQSWPDWQDTLFVLLNPALAAVTALQGHGILHASSLIRDGRSTLIMGISGAGKSTLSAALAMGGMSVHSDDIAVLRWDDDIPNVMQGYPCIKMHPGLPRILGMPDVPMIPVFSDPQNSLKAQTNTSSEYWLSAEHLPGKFHAGPAPLNAIIILGERRKSIKQPGYEKLSAGNAVMALTEHIYGRDWLNLPGNKTLMLCTRLAQLIPVYKVNMPDDLGELECAANILDK